MDTKDDCDKHAKENKVLARRLYEAGKRKEADDAWERAYEWEKARDSWLYRWFGL